MKYGYEDGALVPLTEPDIDRGEELSPRARAIAGVLHLIAGRTERARILRLCILEHIINRDTSTPPELAKRHGVSIRRIHQLQDEMARFLAGRR